MRTRRSSMATTSSTPSSTSSRPRRHSSYTRTAYWAMSSGIVVETTNTCSWLPFRCCSASAWDSSRCTVAESSVPVVSTTGESSGGTGARSCANPCSGRNRASSKTSATTMRPDQGSQGALRRGGAGTARRRGSAIRRRRPGRAAEVHLRRLLDLLQVVDGEVRPGLVPEHLRRQVLRELPDVGVVVLHRGDVALALDGDAVLGALQLRLQLQKVLVGLELRIVLRHQQQPADGALQLALRLLELLQRGLVPRVDVDAAHPRARLGHLAEDLLLVLGVATHGGHQVGHQVGAALVDVDDLRPGRVHRLVLLLDRVVAAPAQQQDQHQCDNPGHALTPMKLLRPLHHRPREGAIHASGNWRGTPARFFAHKLRNSTAAEKPMAP